MTGFRILLSTLLAIVVAYTVVVIANHGMGLVPIFFGAMAEMTWQGQFNLDFMFMLSLSALWVLWRNEFRGVAIPLGLLAFFFGAPFLTAYFLYLSFREDGNVPRMLLGNRLPG